MCLLFLNLFIFLGILGLEYGWACWERPCDLVGVAYRSTNTRLHYIGFSQVYRGTNLLHNILYSRQAGFLNVYCESNKHRRVCAWACMWVCVCGVHEHARAHTHTHTHNMYELMYEVPSKLWTFGLYISMSMCLAPSQYTHRMYELIYEVVLLLRFAFLTMDIQIVRIHDVVRVGPCSGYTSWLCSIISRIASRMVGQDCDDGPCSICEAYYNTFRNCSRKTSAWQGSHTFLELCLVNRISYMHEAVYVLS